jgi:hypothetical protein
MTVAGSSDAGYSTSEDSPLDDSHAHTRGEGLRLDFNPSVLLNAVLALRQKIAKLCGSPI